MAPPLAAAAADDDGENPPTPPRSVAGSEPESSLQQDADSRWLETLSEPELDLVISLKEVAVAQATNAGHPYLADKFHLRTLRALGVVLLQDFKERLKQTSPGVDTGMFQRLALLSDPGVDIPTHGIGSSYSQPHQVLQDQPLPNGVDKKRKQVQHGLDEEGARTSFSKKRRMDEE